MDLLGAESLGCGCAPGFQNISLDVSQEANLGLAIGMPLYRDGELLLQPAVECLVEPAQLLRIQILRQTVEQLGAFAVAEAAHAAVDLASPFAQRLVW